MALTHAVLSFALLGALLTITPGLGTALVLRSAITTGRAPAFVHDLEALVWFAAVITGAQARRGYLRRHSVQRAVDGGTGAVLVGFGLRLGFAGR
jgi:threonine/homoserine/homoserine lactone efflux protein